MTSSDDDRGCFGHPGGVGGMVVGGGRRGGDRGFGAGRGEGTLLLGRVRSVDLWSRVCFTAGIRKKKLNLDASSSPHGCTHAACGSAHRRGV